MLNASPGFKSGLILGTLFLFGAGAVFFIAPDFSGFIDRGRADSRLPIWALLLGFSLINYVYALISKYLDQRKSPVEPPKLLSNDESDEIPHEDHDK